MLKEFDITYHCPTRTLQRARQIAANPRNILTKKCQFDGSMTYLSAFVASSSGWDDRYKTSVTLDEGTNEIDDYSCTCPSFLKYDGMCKHAAALTISYMNDPHSFIGYKENRTPETSPSLVAFMQKTERTMKSDGSNGTIGLEPTLVYGYGEFSVRFKIAGPNGAYVLQDINEFLRNIREGERVSYGKKLSFTHTLDAFTDSGKELVRFIQRSHERIVEASNSFTWHSRVSSGKTRSLNLTEAEVVELLDIIEDQNFTLECTDYSMPQRRIVHIAEGDPHIPLRIAKDGDNGYLINRDQEIVFVAEGGNMYVLQDDVFFHCTPRFIPCADFIRTVYQSNDKQLYLTQTDAPLFCATVLPVLERMLAVEAPDELQAMHPVPGRLRFYFDRYDDLIEIEPFVSYDECRFALFSTDKQSKLAPPLRDEVLERRGRALVRDYFYNQLSIPLSDSELVGELLYGGLARFRENGEVFTTPSFDRLIANKKPHIQIGLSLAGNLIDLDISANDVAPEEMRDLLSSYQKHKKFHRLRNGVFVNLGEYNLHEIDQMLNDFNLSADDIIDGHLEVPTYRAFFLDREFSDAKRNESFTHYVENFTAIDSNAYEAPESLRETLRPYQHEGFAWLNALTDMGFGGILADEMGLGKSLQMISLLLARSNEALMVGPSLIVCPASLVYNWISEFKTFAPQLRVRAIEGTRATRNRIRRETNVDVFIASYDIARMDIDDFEQRTYYCHVLDEAQYIKNQGTLTTRAIKRISSKHRFALTGTPIENRLSEIWSIFDFLMPGFLGSYMRFRERYELDILGGNTETTQRLQWLVAPFILRRLKENVLPDLPDKLESTVYVPLSGEQRKLYDAHEQNLRTQLLQQKKDKSKPNKEISKVEILAELMKLRQVALNPHLLYSNYEDESAKTSAIMDLVLQARDGDEKSLIFSQFTSYLKLIQHELDQQEIPYYTITGSTPKQERLKLVNAFNNDETPVFLVSLKAGGTGLNLTGASVVIHADPWWNAAATNQATDRAHRIGQEKPVSVYKVIAKDTIEERILQLQQAKSQLSESIVEETSSLSLASLTKEELLTLLND